MCSKRGVCVRSNVCECQPGRTGAKCELNVCFGKNETDPSVCSGHGTCRSVDKCDCTHGWKGDHCSDPVCFGIPFDHPDTCSGVGACISADTCDCSVSSGRTGLKCQLSMCFGINETQSNVCSSKGQCIGVDTCSCVAGRAGSNCELNVCYGRPENDPMVCNGNGQCVGSDQCACTPQRGYVGDQCSIPVCHGKRSIDPQVCSGSGSCVSPNNCLCDDGRDGNNCELNLCFGRNSADNLVCSGHGSCTARNNCSCSDGYTGYDCQIPICFGINGTSSNVCHSFGDCVAPDTCTCKDGSSGVQCEVCPNGYHGKFCTVVECFDTFSNDTLACSGHGQCFKPNVCTCNHGYVDDECTMPVCNNILANDTRVCSSRGRCWAFNKCSCNPRFSGHDCELVNNDCKVSSQLMLVSQPEEVGDVQRISLVDAHCGREIFGFVTPGSFHVLHNRYSNTFYMVRQDGIYTFDSTSTSRLDSIPSDVTRHLPNSTVLVSKESLFIVCLLEDTIHVYEITLKANGDLDSRSYSSTMHIPVEVYNPHKYVTVDPSSNTLYVLARRRDDMNIVILRANGRELTEELPLVSFPPLSDVQALMFVHNELYLLQRLYLTKVEDGRLTMVSSVWGGFFADTKYETESHIYLQDTSGQLLMTFSKNEPIIVASFSIFPQELMGKRFRIVDAWEPRIDSLSPSAVPVGNSVDSSGTWISIRGTYLLLENESTITLTDPSLGLSVTSQITKCKSGAPGEVCFQPVFVWPSGRGSIEFTEISIQPVNGSISISQPDYALVYYQPTIVGLGSTTAREGNIITVDVPWFSTTNGNTTCTFVWRKSSGENVTVRVQPVSIYKHTVHCQVPTLEGALNQKVEIYVTMSNRDFNPRKAPAFFYYMDTRSFTFYDTFDQPRSVEVFEPDPSSINNTIIEWINFDEETSRSELRMTSHLSTGSKHRSQIVSKSTIVNQLDQTVHMEFISDSDTFGNVELWYVSASDPNYHVYVSVGVDSVGKRSIGIYYQLGVGVEPKTKQFKYAECPQYSAGVVHTMEMKLVRPEIEMKNVNATLFNAWLAAQPVSTNSTQAVPDEPWRIDMAVKQGDTQICSLSLETEKAQVEQFKRMLSTGRLGIAQSVPPSPSPSPSPSRSLQAQQRRSDSVLTVELKIDRVWISCQYDSNDAAGCNNVTQIPKNYAGNEVFIRDSSLKVSRFTDSVASIMIFVAVGLFVLFVILSTIPLLVFGFWKLWRFTKRRLNQHGHAGGSSSSDEDEFFIRAARKIHRTDVSDETRLRKILISKMHLGTVSSDVTDVTTSTDTCVSECD